MTFLKKRETYILFSVFVYSFILQYFSLSKTEFANGWDSYFYLVQVKSYLEEGSMVSSRISLFYPFIICIKFFISDYVIAWKVSATITAALFPILVFHLIKAFGKENNIAYVGIAIAVISPHLYYFTAQYTKNMFGVDMLFLFLIFLYRNKYYWILPGLILTILTHKLCGGLAFISLIIWLVLNANKRLLIISGAGLIIGFTIMVLAPIVFDVSDLYRQTNILTGNLQFTLLNFFSDFKGRLNILWKAEFVLSFVFAVASTILIFYKKDKLRLLLIPVLILLLNLPFLNWELQGYSFRMFMLTPFFLPLLAAISIPTWFNKRISVIISLLILSLSYFSVKTYIPEKHDPPYKKYQIITHRLRNNEAFDKMELVIAHKALAEFIKFTTNKDAMSWLPEYEIDSTKLWRVAVIERPILEFYQLPDHKKSISRLAMNYVLLPEWHWQCILSGIKKNDSALYYEINNWQNPSSIRPDFMKKYKVEKDN